MVCYIRSVMFFSRFRKKKIEEVKKNPDQKDDFMKLGKEQFKKLVERGTDIPVVLL